VPAATDDVTINDGSVEIQGVRSASTVTPDATTNIDLKGTSNISAFLTIGNGFTNTGKVGLSSDSNNGGVYADLNINGGDFNNQGNLNLNENSASLASQTRRVTANVRNTGTVEIEPNVQAWLDKGTGTFENQSTVNIGNNSSLQFGYLSTFQQTSGVVNNNGSFVMNGDTLDFDGGHFTGNNLYLASSTLDIALGATGTLAADFSGVSKLIGSVKAVQILNLNATSNTSSFVTSAVGLANDGVINLNSDSNNTGVFADFNVTAGTFNNRNKLNLNRNSTLLASQTRRVTANGERSRNLTMPLCSDLLIFQAS
jgi:hypothetical protein